MKNVGNDVMLNDLQIASRICSPEYGRRPAAATAAAAEAAKRQKLIYG